MGRHSHQKGPPPKPVKASTRRSKASNHRSHQVRRSAAATKVQSGPPTQRTQQSSTCATSPSTTTPHHHHHMNNSLLSLANWTNPNPKQLGPFNDRKRILTIGDGDFSFSLALAVFLGGKNITATCYDSRQEIASKYPTGLSNVESLHTTGARVFFQIDATRLPQTLPKSSMPEVFDSIVFNFPHLGGATEEDIANNQKLLYRFFKSSRQVVSNPPRGEVLVSLRRTLFYDKWLIEQQAARAGLQLKRKERFDAKLYAGYEPQRTHPASFRGEPPTTQGAITYVFQINPAFQPSEQDSDKDEDVQEQLKNVSATRKKAKSADTTCFCVVCHLQCKDLKKYNAHINSAKHARRVKAQNKSQSKLTQ